MQKKTLKSPILRVQGHLRWSMSITLKSSSPVLVVISMPVPICNCFHDRRANIKNNHFRGVLLFDPPPVSLNLNGWESGLGLLKSTFDAEILLQAVLVYLQPFQCNSLLNCVSQHKIPKNLLKSLILWVQVCSRSSILIPLQSWSGSACYNEQHVGPVCLSATVFMLNEPISISISIGSTSLSRLRSKGTPSHNQRHEISSQKLESLGQPTVNISWF